MLPGVQGVQGPAGYYNTYLSDPYLELINKIRGTLSLVNMMAWNISSSTYSTAPASFQSLYTQQKVDLDNYTSDLTNLTQQFRNLLNKGERPTLATFSFPSGFNELIGQCNLIITTYQNQLKDIQIKDKGWHFQGILTSVTNLKETLEEANLKFK